MHDNLKILDRKSYKCKQGLSVRATYDVQIEELYVFPVIVCPFHCPLCSEGRMCLVSFQANTRKKITFPKLTYCVVHQSNLKYKLG